MIRLSHLSLQIETVDVRQFDVQDQAGRDVRLVGGDIVAGRPECDAAHTVRCQKFVERLADANVVIHDEYDVVVAGHAATFASTGKVKTNVAPVPSPLSDRKSTRLNSSHSRAPRMPSSA